jgi:hypothetical protein
MVVNKWFFYGTINKCFIYGSQQMFYLLHSKQMFYLWRFDTLLYSIAFFHLMVWFMMFNTTFNNISVISWQSVLLIEEPKKTTDLPRVSDKLYHIILYWVHLCMSHNACTLYEISIVLKYTLGGTLSSYLWSVVCTFFLDKS